MYLLVGRLLTFQVARSVRERERLPDIERRVSA